MTTSDRHRNGNRVDQPPPVTASIRGWNGAAVVFALLLPSLVTWVYFVVLARFPASLQQSAYGLGKGLQFLFPVFWWVAVQRRRLVWQLPRGPGWMAGCLSGLAILAATWVLYVSVLEPQAVFASAEAPILNKVRGFGVRSVWTYDALGAFYSLIHSGLEEYYWRWFVFGQLRERTTRGRAVLISSLGFMAHHVIVLGFYFGWHSPWVYLLSLAVAIGGAFWAWLYDRTGSLAGPWLSHMLVDAGIFAVGYRIVGHAL